MNTRIAFFVIAAALSGCASVLDDSFEQIKVETKSQSGDLVTGAECKLSNVYGTLTVRSGNTVMIRRSGQDLGIVCTDANNPDATARAISRANGLMWRNLALGGAVSGIAAHEDGTAYSYPTWVQLVFGKSLVFDRAAEKKGQPVPAAAEMTPVSSVKPQQTEAIQY